MVNFDLLHEGKAKVCFSQFPNIYVTEHHLTCFEIWDTIYDIDIDIEIYLRFRILSVKYMIGFVIRNALF